MFANFGIAIAKFVGFAFTGAASMLAEAIHSCADTANQGLLFLGGALSRREATEEHVVAREIHTRVGEPLAYERLEADVQRLKNLQIFSEIEVEVASGERLERRLSFEELDGKRYFEKVGW